MSERNRTRDRGANGMMPILTYKEIGALMGISQHSAQKIEGQALEKLRDMLEEMGVSRDDVFPPKEHRVFIRERFRPDADGMGQHQ